MMAHERVEYKGKICMTHQGLCPVTQGGNI